MFAKKTKTTRTNTSIRLAWLALLIVVAAVVLASCGSGSASSGNDAEGGEFPEGPVTIIVPFTPGGSFDTVARGLAPQLQEELGVPVVVENVPGAEGMNRIANSPPDGQTFGIIDLIAELGLRIVQPPSYDVTEYEYLGRVGKGINIVGGSSENNIDSLDDLENTQEPVRCASFGSISTPALQCILLSEEMGFPMSIVTFPGPAEATVGTARGDADIYSATPPSLSDSFEARTTSPLLVWSSEPLPESLPEFDAPNLTDVGLEDLDVLGVERAIVTSPGTPPERIQALSTALEEAIDSDEFQEFLRERDYETNALIDSERYNDIVQDIQELLQQNEAVIKEYAEGGR